MAKRVTIQSALGKLEGTEVNVTGLVGETSFEVHLEDGTILNVKPSILQVVRLDNQWDSDGNPAYNVRSQLAMFVSKTPDELRRQVQ